MAIKKILVTGSSGTIGTRLCEKLLEQNYEVIGVDWKPNKWNEKVNEITINVDLRNSKELEKLPKDVDIVVHLAANARVYNLVENPELAKENFETLFNTLEFCRKNNIKRFLFSSSREVYGNSGQTTYTEDEVDIRRCESPYTASKLGGETLIYSYQNCFGLNYIITRFSNVYGMYDESDRVIPLFIRQTLKGEDLTVFGKEKLLDFTYIDDTVDGVIKCIEKFDEVKNDIFNIATGKANTIIEVAELIQKYLNVNTKINITDNRTGEVVKFIADISKAKEKLGFDPKIRFEEGIKKNVEWYSKLLEKQ